MNIRIQLGNSWMFIGEHYKNIHRVTIYRKNETIYSTLEYISQKTSLIDLLNMYCDLLWDHYKFFNPEDYDITQSQDRIDSFKEALLETYEDFKKNKSIYRH